MATTIARVVHEYKESKYFEDDAGTAGVDAYVFGFIDYQDAVAQA